MVSAKVALWTPLSKLEGAPVWTAQHPTRGLVLVTRYDGDWRECKIWCGKIAGTDPEYGMKREFFNRHTNSDAAVVFWEVPTKVIVQVGHKASGLNVYLWINEDKSIQEVERVDVLSYAISQDQAVEYDQNRETGVYSDLPLAEEQAVQAEYDGLKAKGIPLGSFMDYLTAYIGMGDHRLKPHSA